MNPIVILLAAAMATGPAPPGLGASKAPSKGGHLSTNDSLHKLLSHPALADFSRMLLPYHTQVYPTTVVGAFNRRIDVIGQDQRMFYEFCSEAQQQQPARGHTGLFFFRGKPGVATSLGKSAPSASRQAAGGTRKKQEGPWLLTAVAASVLSDVSGLYLVVKLWTLLSTIPPLPSSATTFQ